MTTDTYRTRVYRQYVYARSHALAPHDVAGLAPRAPALRRLIRNHFPVSKDAVLLDTGCGHGALMYFAREAGYSNIRGVDGSLEQVTAARRLGIEGVEEGDLRQVLEDQPAESIDVVVSFDVIEHFTRDELLPFVDQVYRVLKKGGRWILHVPNGESPFFGAIRYGDLTHELAFTAISLSQLLLSSRFSGVDCFEDAPTIHGAKSVLRWLLWKAFRALMRLYVAAETGDVDPSRVFSRNMLAVAIK